jgi:hypothetical protein
MGVDRTVIGSVRVTPSPRTREVVVAWESSAPAGTVYRVRADGRRAGPDTTALSVTLPWPAAATVYEVGAVDATTPTPPAGADEYDFPEDAGDGDGVALGARSAVVRWLGGRWQSADLRAFRVYANDGAGGAIDYGDAVGEVESWPDGADPPDGAGRGGAGRGGAGHAAMAYSYRAGDLGAGDWSFGVKGVDRWGQLSAAVEAAVVLVAPPRPPAADADGKRLTYEFDTGTGVATLSWLASPDA